MTTYIVINRHVIAKNRKHGLNDPPIRITQGKYGKPIYASGVTIEGTTRLIYDAEKPILPCGARLAIATDGIVRKTK